VSATTDSLEPGATAVATAPLKLCTFRIADLFFGIDILLVEEAVHDRPVTVVPLAPSTMAGVLNLRGRILSAIDLRARLELPARGPTKRQPPHLVVRSSLGEVSLVVDRLDGVIDVTNEDREAPPAHLGPQMSDLVQGVYKLDTGLLLVLDIERTVQISS
jgi:purine-binding chemotaxis protein CheW